MTLKVLIFDDYKVMLRIVRNLLKRTGIEDVQEASSGIEALFKLRSGKFDLIIADWDMGEMTGVELLKRVRGDERLKAIPFVMIANESRVEYFNAARQAGMFVHIVKPFSSEMLRGKINEALKAAATKSSPPKP